MYVVIADDELEATRLMEVFMGQGNAKFAHLYIAKYEVPHPSNH
jgi:hypothetical protein